METKGRLDFPLGLGQLILATFVLGLETNFDGTSEINDPAFDLIQMTFAGKNQFQVLEDFLLNFLRADGFDLANDLLAVNRAVDVITVDAHVSVANGAHQRSVAFPASDRARQQVSAIFAGI